MSWVVYSWSIPTTYHWKFNVANIFLRLPMYQLTSAYVSQLQLHTLTNSTRSQHTILFWVFLFVLFSRSINSRYVLPKPPPSLDQWASWLPRRICPWQHVTTYPLTTVFQKILKLNLLTMWRLNFKLSFLIRSYSNSPILLFKPSFLVGDTNL